MIRQYSALALMSGLMLTACADFTNTMPRSTSDLSGLSPQPESRAGVAQVDITPPPGLGLFGHGPESRIAEGTLLRLRCHAFVFMAARAAAPGQTEALALVPCDLAAPSLLLQREVSKRVRALGLPLGADRIWISATHTHAAPAHYFASDSFNGPTSGRRIGFDRAVLDFLAERIANAVSDAYHDLKPARWTWLSEDVFGLGRNRAYAAFTSNRALPDKLSQQLRSASDDITQSAVDPQLSLLRIDQRAEANGRFAPAAALVVFGLHPTAIDHENALYGGDVFGYAERVLAQALGMKHERNVLVGFANGIEGDVTPVRTDGTVEEAKRLGSELAAHALALWERRQRDPAQIALEPPSALSSAYRDLDFAGAHVWRAGKLCQLPELGTPAGGGADDHPTFLRMLEPFNPGVQARTPRACQGPKYPIVNLGEPLAGKSFPRFAPVSAAILGNGLLVAVPAEVTTVAGMRIRDTARAASAGKLGANPVIAVVGLTNEYIEYVATADEYALQRYEGASTLYGPQSAEFLREQTACLVSYLRDGQPVGCNQQTAKINEPIEVGYTPSFETPWLKRVGPETKNAILTLSAPQTVFDPGRTPALASTLRGAAPGDSKVPESFAIEVRHGETLIDDSQGISISVHWNDRSNDWLLTWRPERSALAALCGRKLTFHVLAAKRRVASKEGTFDCSLELARAKP